MYTRGAHAAQLAPVKHLSRNIGKYVGQAPLRILNSIVYNGSLAAVLVQECKGRFKHLSHFKSDSTCLFGECK